MRFFAVALIFFGVAASYAQTPEVPHKMRFADMTLTIRDDARREIQKDVDALTKSPKYFGVKVERARTYFPFIEKVFAEERLPDDFKYLVLQESALISDAVSVSNAVGFWQFKDFTAMEMGMRVDKEIDERMNIVSASRGAAKYLKQSNYQFNNWLFALQAYQMGAGGVKRAVGDEFNGAKHMEITSDTYWYIKKFLAHKIAYEDAVKGEPQVKVEAIELKEKRMLADLVKELSIDEAELRASNKWIRSNVIPGDRTYVLVLPKGKYNAEFNTLVVPTAAVATSTTGITPDKSISKEINGVKTIQAVANEKHAALASRAGVGLTEFLKFNDLSITDPIKGGEFYFTSKKKNKSKTLTHTLAEGEDLWAVSQHYGVSLKKIKKLNRLSADDRIKPGDVVWVGARKPADQPVEEVVTVAVVEEQNGQSDYFNWDVNPGLPTPVAKNDAVVSKIESKPVVINESEGELVVNENRQGVHTVVPGETLYALAKRYKVEVTQLLEWNQLDITKGLKPGQEISVVGPASTTSKLDAKLTDSKKDEWVMHEVKTSDTLYSIARQYNVTIKEIMDWNSKSDFTLSQGEKLKILSK